MIEQDLLKRVEMLEQQVRALQSKVNELEQNQVIQTDSKLLNERIERTIVARAKLQADQPAQRVPIAQQIPHPEPIPKKPRKTFEQTITTILPKIFIVILVLGVLWGLKVASDYGYFNDGLKIVLGYIGSVALLAIAVWMEKKQKGSMQVVLMLYGGAFVVGILTTAAGAILYETLGLYVALFIAIIYIGYGVAISYVKGAESLTALVVLTSFLLPYLLEYMSFNEVIIVAYIVLLFGVLQLVILKHQQKYALYAGTALSILALMIIAWTATTDSVIYPLAIVAVGAVYLLVIRKLLPTVQEKYAAIHTGFVFSFLMYIVLAVNAAAMFDRTAATIGLVLLTLAYAASAFLAKKAEQRALFDVSLSATLIAFLTMILYVDASYTTSLLLVFVTVAVGLLLANRLRAVFMQLVYSFLFIIMTLIIVGSGDIQPFWSVAHLTYLLVIVALVALYVQVRKPLDNPTKFELARQKLQIFEWTLIVLYFVVLLYSMYFQQNYLQDYSMQYLSLLLIAGVFAAALYVMPVEKHEPLFIVAGLVFAVAYVMLVANSYASHGEIFVGLLMRLLYLIIVGSALYHFMQGGIVQQKLAKAKVDMVWMSTMIALLVGVFGVMNFMDYNDVVQWHVLVIVNTLAIFVAASISLFIGGKRDVANIRLFGLALLGVGIVKLIFFDLSALDLLVRSVLFIVIGGAGLVLTNKLLTKK